MAKVTVFQFKLYDPQNDQIVKSRRWATRKAIDWLRGTVLDETETEADEAVIGLEVEGLSDIGYNPHAMQGFQRQVKA
jgi:hypothetical protein